MSSHSGGLSVCSNECELTVRRGRSWTIYTCGQSLLDGEKSPRVLERGGLAWGMSTSGLLPPFPQPNCAVKWAKSTAGEFRIHRKLLRVDFTRICKWAKLTRIGLDRAFWSSYLEYLKEEGGSRGSCVPGCIFYQTCLMFKRGGEQALFLSLLVKNFFGQNDKWVIIWSKLIAILCFMIKLILFSTSIGATIHILGEDRFGRSYKL